MITPRPHASLLAALSSALSAALFAAATDAQDARPYTPVTDTRLVAPEAENWLMYRGTYNGWGYSTLDAIDRGNVAELKVAWTLSTGVREGHQAPPIVNDGVMFVTTPGNQVYALDAKTGDVLWLYRRQLPFDVMQLHPTNRGVALHGDKVYMATVDAVLVALDAATGQVVWETPVEDYRRGYYMTLAPLAANGKIMVGVSGGELGIRGFVAAFDADTGAPVWKTYTIPAPGEPGSETWPDDESWRTGGAPVWVTGTFDPDLNLSYWGTGNGGPWTGDTRPGDSLYATSVIALDVDTGELKGHHQYHWNDSWDWDEVSAPILMDVVRGGRTIKALVHPARNGYLWLLERTRDRIGFVDAQPFVAQNVFTRIDPTTGRPDYDRARKPAIGFRASFCPSLWGGKDWPPAAYSPQTGLVYIPANENLCSEMEGEEAEYRVGQRFTGATSELYVVDGADHIGELQAWNMNTGERVWTHEFAMHNWGPVLTTAGGLVFAGGTQDRYFRAFDARTGRVLWEQRTNSGVTGVPVTYAVDGVQYVAVQSGWGVDAARMQGAIERVRGPQTETPQGGVVWVFALAGAVD